MSRMVADAAPARQDQLVARPSAGEVQSLDLTSEARPQGLDRTAEDVVENQDLARVWLRESIDEAGGKDAAVALTIGLKGESGANYFSKMLRGEKPIGSRHLRALPDDIRRIYASKQATHEGLIVAVPAADEQQALRYLMSALAFLLQSRGLPAKADRMAKASLPYSGVERRHA